MGDKTKKDFEAENEWPIEAILTLEAWKKQLGFRMGAHIYSQRWYKRLHKFIKMPTTIFTTLLGASAITSLSKDPQWSSVATIITLTLTIMLAILTALDTAFKPESLGERHKVASDYFQKIIRTINQILILVGGTHTTYKPTPYITLNNVREQIDSAISSSPMLPKKFDASLSSFDLVRLLVKERKKRQKREAKVGKIAEKVEIYQLRVGAGVDPSLSISADEDEIINDVENGDSKLSFQMIGGNLVTTEEDPRKKDLLRPELDIGRLMDTPDSKMGSVMKDEQDRMNEEIKRLTSLHDTLAKK